MYDIVTNDKTWIYRKIQNKVTVWVFQNEQNLAEVVYAESVFKESDYAMFW